MQSGISPSVVQESATFGKLGVVRFLMAARGAGAARAIRETRGGERVGKECGQEVSDWGAGSSLAKSFSMTAYKCCMDMKAKCRK
jgi:hypothetical protein